MIGRALCPTLIGRDDELSALEDAMLEAVQGQGRLVALAGEAGVGKTRLARQLTLEAAKLGCIVLWGSCSEADLSLPYLPFLEAIGNTLTRADVGDVRERLGVSARDLARLFPQLGVDPGSIAGDDPSQLKLRLYEAVLKLLTTIADEQPIVLVIEDLHWADKSTHELVEYMARRLATLPILLIATYRSEEIGRQHPLRPTLHAWRRTRSAETIELSLLGPSNVARMVGAIFDESEVSQDFRDYLYQRSEGNPFVVEEMLKEALDSGAIFRSDKGWDRTSIAELHIPETVRDAILVRLERLEAEQVDVLRSAAVIGSSFAFATLVDLRGIDAAPVEAVLRACIRQQLLEEDEAELDGFRFRHDLTWEVIYRDMTAPERARMHGRVADVLERRGAPAAARARHLAGANRVGEAVPLWIAAAEAALQSHAYVDAAALYQHAVSHIADPLLRARTEGCLGDALWRAGPKYVRAAAAHLESCVADLETAQAGTEAIHHRVILGNCYLVIRDSVAARCQYEFARGALEELGSNADLATTFLGLSALEFGDGHWSAAAGLAQQAIDASTEVQADGPRLLGYMRLGEAMAADGKAEEGLALLDRSYREALDRDLDIVAGHALNNTIGMRFELIRARECPPLIEEMRKLPGGLARQKAMVWDGYIGLYLGSLDRSRIAFREAVEAGDLPGMYQRLSAMMLAWVLAEQERGGEARDSLPSPDLSAGPYDSVYEAIVWSRYHLAMGTPKEALPIVDRLLVLFGGLPPGRLTVSPEVSDAVIAVLIATGNDMRAADIALEVSARELTWSPWGKMAHARHLLREGDTDASRRLLSEAAAEFATAGYRIAEIEARLLLADAHIATGDVTSAAREARGALVDAQGCQAARLATKATNVLGIVGPLDKEAASHAVVGEDKEPPPPDILAVDAPPTARAGVLVSGVRCGTARAGSRPAADMAGRIASFQRWARGEIARRRGIVDIAAGDLVTAVFNVAGAAADPCLQALHAAVALRDKAALLDLSLGVGVAVSPTVTSRIAQQTTHSVLDETIELACSLQADAGADEVLLSEEVHGYVHSWLEERRLPISTRLLSLTGRDQQVTAYTLRRRLVKLATRDRPAPAATESLRGPAVSDADATATANLFRRDGDYWTIAYRGAVIRVKDTKGVRDLAALLGRPGREVAAIDLAAAAAAALPPSAHSATEVKMGHEGDAGSVLDAEARRQYRERLVDLEEEVNLAELANDPERATQALEEREFLLMELSAAVGLGGRDRRMSDPAERARKAVTGRIRDAIARIETADKTTGAHFRRSVSTGTFCVYDPSEPTAWSV